MRKAIDECLRGVDEKLGRHRSRSEAELLMRLSTISRRHHRLHAGTRSFGRRRSRSDAELLMGLSALSRKHQRLHAGTIVMATPFVFAGVYVGCEFYGHGCRADIRSGSGAVGNNVGSSLGCQCFNWGSRGAQRFSVRWAYRVVRRANAVFASCEVFWIFECTGLTLSPLLIHPIEIVSSEYGDSPVLSGGRTSLTFHLKLAAHC